MPHRANSVPGNLRANRIRHPRAKHNSVGGGISANANQLVHTFSGGAFTFNHRPHMQRLRFEASPSIPRFWNAG